MDKIIKRENLSNIFCVPPEQLVFDKNNSRLLSEDCFDKEQLSEIDIIKLLIKYDIDELLLSIAQNGYLNIEPLYVVQENGGRYKVIEGNRRLAALKLFRDQTLAEECGIMLPVMELSKAKTLDSILVYVSQNENSALAYIGFKHINGPHKWDSIAKARFVLNLYKRGFKVSDISKMIGDTHDTIRKMLLGILVLEQAAEEEIFTTEDRYPSLKVLPFSHLYTALTRKEYRKFLGIEKIFSDHPVPQEKMENLRKVLRWIFGSKKDDIKPVIQSQNPDIKSLGTIILNTSALSILETTNSLDSALQQTMPANVAFKDALIMALFKSKEALGFVSDVDKEDKDAKYLSSQLKNVVTSICSIIDYKVNDENIKNEVYEKLMKLFSSNASALDILKNI